LEELYKSLSVAARS